ncbi:MAG: tRNA 2-selenouridine(34) synthase MnmH, partial [Burkholderiales bacterium]
VDTLAELPRKLSLKVVCGATGSGKSRILQALGRLGEQVLDLEELACHKGSVLGVLPDAAQPSQKMFDSKLRLVLHGFDLARPVYVEAESRKIGSIHLPDALIETMRSAECVNIDAAFDARVEFLLRDYDYFLTAPDWLRSRLAVLHNLQSRETIVRWHDYVSNAQWRELVSELLEMHYDPLYQRSQNRNYAGFGTPRSFVTDDLTPAGIEAIARQISGRASETAGEQATNSA